MPNCPRQLKIIEGLYKKANEDGLLSSLLYWYKLKSINVEGHFKKIPKLNYSISYNYKQIAILIRLGWLIKKSDGYYLTSYDNLFEKFGIIPVKKKIFKIVDLAQFEVMVWFNEIRLNLFRQRWVIKKKIKYLMQKTQKGKDIIEYYSTLSCRGISNLLGFLGPKKGYQIEKKLEEINLINITKRNDSRGNPMTSILNLLFKETPILGKKTLATW